MVITMKDDAVRIYNISEEKYEQYLSEGTDNYRLLKYCVAIFQKFDYSPELLKGDASRATTYYYDNGIQMVKKDVKDVKEIKYYKSNDGKLYPSRDFYQYSKKNPSRMLSLSKELTELDYKLDNSIHVNQIFEDDLLDDFKAYYDTLNTQTTNEFTKGKYYNVSTYIKLILNPSKTSKGKLTAAKLKGSICLIVTPIGIDASGEIKYSFTEFALDKYIDKINSKFIIIKNKNNKTADNMSDIERFDFLESAAIEVIHEIQDEILSRTNTVIFNSNGITWEEYSEKFLVKYGFDLINFDSKKWKIYIETLLDSRTIHNGYIVPLVIENEHQKVNTNNQVENVRTMTRDELLVPESDKIDEETFDEEPYSVEEDDYSDEDRFILSNSIVPHQDLSFLTGFTDESDLPQDNNEYVEDAENIVIIDPMMYYNVDDFFKNAVQYTADEINMGGKKM